MDEARTKRMQEKARGLSSGELTSYILHVLGYSMADVSVIRGQTEYESANDLLAAGSVLGRDGLLDGGDPLE